MPSLVLGSALAFFPGVRSRNSVCGPGLSKVEGPRCAASGERGPRPSFERAPHKTAILR